MRQESDLGQMLWTCRTSSPAVDALRARAGDLIFTGTPAGVGALKPGDRAEGGIEGLEVLRNTIAAAARDAA